MTGLDLMNSLVATMEEYDDKLTVQEALDGVRDFVCALLVTEDVNVDSFCEAVKERMPDVISLANRLRAGEVAR